VSVVAARRRSSGAGLLLLAVVGAIGAYAAVGLGKVGRVPSNLALYGPALA
jgi:hypothetical protein